MKWLTDYLEQKRSLRNKEEYNRGFGWAVTAFFQEKQSTEEIEAYVYGRNGYFDRGAYEGLRIIENLIDNVECKFAIDDEVIVYDKYRFAIPVFGRIFAFSLTNDGVEVMLDTTNNLNFPIRNTIWVDRNQLKLKVN